MKRRDFIATAFSAAAVATLPGKHLFAESSRKNAIPSTDMSAQHPAIPRQFKGMMPILPTTVNPDGSLDLESQRKLVHYALDCGAVAIGHLAFASEFFKLTVPERGKVISTLVAEVNGQVPVFIGVSGPSNRIAVEYAKQAQDLGADMLMASIPYVTVPDWKTVRGYYKDVCSATPLPVILQDTGLSAAMFTPEHVLELADENPNMRNVKPEGPDFLTKTVKLKEMAGDRFDITGGYGGKHMIHMLRRGVTSFMTGTEALDLHAAVVNAYLSGDAARSAQLYYDKLLPYFMFYEQYSEELLKRMLYQRGIIACPDALKPAVPSRMSEVEMAEFQWTLERIPFTPWKDSPLNKHKV